MTPEIVRKVLGRSARTSNEIEQAVAELRVLENQHPGLAAHFKVLIDVLPPLFEKAVTEQPPVLTKERAISKLTDGIPLLRGETLQIDLKQFRRRWQAVCNAVDRQRDDQGASKLSHALHRKQLDANQLLRQLLDGRLDAIHAQAAAAGLDPDLTSTVLRLSLFPVISHFNQQLEPLRKGFKWKRGFCPTCGRWPLLGEYRGLEQIRFLRCELCAAEWEYPRLECPNCGTRDHNRLGYFQVDGEGTKFRVTTCDECRGYVKMASTLMSLEPSQLLVTDAATMHLDLAATERGYTVGP